MDSQLNKIINTFSSPRNHTEVLLRLFHQNRLPQNVKQKEISMCSKCLTPWTSGKFDLSMRPSNTKRVTRRNHRIERLQSQIKSKEASVTDARKISKKIKRLQQQNNHVASYKCFCTKNAKTKVQLRKKQIDKHNKSENVTSVMIMSKQKEQQDDSNVKEKVKIKKKKKKTAGLLIPTKTAASVKMDVTSISSSTTLQRKSMAKISKMLKQQKNIDETKQQSKLNQFFK